MNKVLIFDFDGTLADTLNLIIKIYNQDLSEKFNIRRVDVDNIGSLKHLDVSELIRMLDIPWYKIPFIFMNAKRVLGKRINEIELFDGVVEKLLELEAQGHKIYMITSNSRKIVLPVLEKFGIENCFGKIITGSSLWGKGKLINKIINQDKLTRSNVIYIGDEVRDIHGAKKARVLSAAVSWGFNSRDKLENSNPNMIFDSVESLEFN